MQQQGTIAVEMLTSSLPNFATIDFENGRGKREATWAEAKNQTGDHQIQPPIISALSCVAIDPESI